MQVKGSIKALTHPSGYASLASWSLGLFDMPKKGLYLMFPVFILFLSRKCQLISTLTEHPTHLMTRHCFISEIHQQKYPNTNQKCQFDKAKTCLRRRTPGLAGHNTITEASGVVSIFAKCDHIPSPSLASAYLPSRTIGTELQEIF